MENKSETFKQALQALSVGGDLNRALSDILAWAELRALDGADPMIPGTLWDNAQSAIDDWRRTLGVYSAPTRNITRSGDGSKSS